MNESKLLTSQSSLKNISAKSSQSPLSALLKPAFIRLRVIEAKDIYIGQGRNADSCELYAMVSYGTTQMGKTRAIADTSPFWDQTLEFDYDNYASQGANVITITIFDSDSLGSDQQIATQAIPLQYFKERGKFGKPLDLWLKLGYLEDYGIREQIIVEGNGSLFVQTDTPDFPDQFATEEDKQNTRIPKLHILLEIYDPVSVLRFTISITDIEEDRRGPVTHILYVIKVSRNDGERWEVKKRYSEIAQFRNFLKQQDDEVKSLPFPRKSAAKFMSQFCLCLQESYRKKSEQRMHRLEQFLNGVASINYFYNLDEFAEFFASEEIM